MRNVIESLEGEYRRYRDLGELAMSQLSEDEMSRAPAPGSNSIVNLVWHLSGNLHSRFTDFLATDGEKAWRLRAEEFQPRAVSREELLERWNLGWETLFTSLGRLSDRDLSRVVTIHGVPHRVDQALHRSLAHATYHVGQIVYIAKSTRGSAWQDLKELGRKRAAES